MLEAADLQKHWQWRCSLRGLRTSFNAGADGLDNSQLRSSTDIDYAYHEQYFAILTGQGKNMARSRLVRELLLIDRDLFITYLDTRRATKRLPLLRDVMIIL